MLELLRRKPEVEAPVKEPIDLGTFEIPPEEYLRVASSVNYTPKTVIEEKTIRKELALLADLGLSIFSNEQVALYLDKIYGRPRFHFHGMRVRAKWGWRYLENNGGGAYNPTENGEYLCGPYIKAIPFPVLRTMEQIKDSSYSSKGVGAPTFLISDTVRETDFVRDPDPFLACYWGAAYKVHIVERWDEPSFRME